MSTSERNLVVAQGGGPTAVINQSLVGIITEARKYSQISHIFGAKYGVKGITDEKFLDLTELSSHHLEAVAQTPSSALFSTRDKPDEEYCKKILGIFDKYNIHYFCYIGGNDSAETCRLIGEAAKSEQYDLRLIHVPKTIDNDLLENDHCPGFPSAAKYVAQAFAGINLDNKALPGIHIVIVMGRNSGFLTGASAYARKYADDGPHLIYVPEKPFISKKFFEDVKKVYDRLGRCIVAISEGIRDEKEIPIAERFNKGQIDAFGNVQFSGTGALGDDLVNFIKSVFKLEYKKENIRARADILGYPQRSFLGCVSEVDQKEAREVGEKAIQFAVGQNKSGSVSIQRIANYAVRYELKELEEIAGKTKYMSDAFINEKNNNVTKEYIDYFIMGVLGIDAA
ncbi:MAG TPA: 6-phosphofructokinase, partial [Candidatus Hydrogenedens sp.]|nr:6-phosphofructokinase [Candidatus Hydrogenedens sp.]